MRNEALPCPALPCPVRKKTGRRRYSQIPHIASLAAGLSRYHPSLGVRLVDALLEGITAGLEAPDAGVCHWALGGRSVGQGRATGGVLSCRGSACAQPRRMVLGSAPTPCPAMPSPLLRAAQQCPAPPISPNTIRPPHRTPSPPAPTQPPRPAPPRPPAPRLLPAPRGVRAAAGRGVQLPAGGLEARLCHPAPLAGVWLRPGDTSRDDAVGAGRPGGQGLVGRGCRQAWKCGLLRAVASGDGLAGAG